MKVLKFGGTSVGSAERIKNVSSLINDGEKKIVVLSAMSGTTNSLVEISDYYHKGNTDSAIELINKLEQKYFAVIKELLTTDTAKNEAKAVLKEQIDTIRGFVGKDFSLNEEKSILARGELISTNLVNIYNNENGIPSVLLPALDFMMVDDDGEPIIARIEEKLTALLSQYPDTEIFITQGFITTNPQNAIDNLKRGGSDYTATLIGAAIKADDVEIWTDIDGVHNNDPRVVDNTYPIAQLSFDEAAELAYFGAKILHPATVLPAKVANIPVRLKNTLDPEAPGTAISNKVTGEGIKAVAAKDGITAIKIKSGRMLLAYGFLRKVFEIFESYKTSIDMITTSEVAVSLTIDNTDYLGQIVEELKKFATVEIDKEQTIICVVGNMISDNKGYAVDILEALGDITVRMISYGGSKHNISLLIDHNNKDVALKALNKNIFNS